MGLEQRLQEWFALYLNGKGVLYCASAGGMRTNIQTGIKMKRAGYKKGHPHMIIYEPRGPYHAMAIELKFEGKPTDEQKEWNTALLARGYYSIIMPHNLSFGEAQIWLERETMGYLYPNPK